MNRPELSIVIPTCQRADLLAETIDAIERTVACRWELIVVDGASTDHTPDVLGRASRRLGRRLHVIPEPRREGFVRAVNRGFRAARGEYLTWLNDDARPSPGCLDAALDQLRHAPADVGLLALFHRMDAERSLAYQTWQQGRSFQIMHVRGTLYANFGVGLKQTFEALDYFDERFYFCGADPDFSLKCWHAGLRVMPAFGCLVDHDEHEDERRATDLDRGAADNHALFAKWSLPPKNPRFNDFDPAQPCTLSGLRGPEGSDEPVEVFKPIGASPPAHT